MNVMKFLIPKSQVVFIGEDSTVRQAYEKMRYHRYTAVPVIDGEGKYVGTLRNDDLFAYFMEGGTSDTREAESTPLTYILDRAYSKPLYHNATMAELIDAVREHNFVAIVDDRGCFVGIVLRRDVLNFLFGCYEKSMARAQAKKQQ